MVAKSTRSRKTKGFDFQKYIAERIRDVFGLEERDVVSTPSSVPGEDIILSNRALELFPYSVEAKRQEKLNVWASLNQAIRTAEKVSIKKDINLPGLLVFKRNYSRVYCAMDFEDFLDMRKRIVELEEELENLSNEIED